MSNKQIFTKMPSVFSFQRSMIVSAGAFYNEIDGQSELTPVYVVRHGIRGTQNVGGDGESVKGGKARGVGNIQQTETAMLDARANALVVKFGLRMIDLDSALHACAALEQGLAGPVRDSVDGFVKRAKGSAGLKEVSRRIARNIANGSFLWRNRTLARSVEVKTEFEGRVVKFDALKVPMAVFSDYSAEEKQLADIIEAGLGGDREASIAVTARVDFGVKGAVEVFPSQAYIEKKPDGFARPLYKLGGPPQQKAADGTEHETVLGQAALRDQKISNRLRTIDTWYEEYELLGKAMPLEPNGASIDMMRFFRLGKASAFSMFSRLNEIDPNSPEGMFCIGTMIRGGVLSGGSEKGKDKAGAAEEATVDEDEGE